MNKLNQIFKRLKMDRQNGLFITAENRWHGILPPRFRWLIDEKLKPTAFFCLDKKPLVLFYESPANKKELFRAIWNFNESPVVIINEPDTVEIFNGFSYLKDKSTLEKLEDKKKLDNFSYFELVTGKSLEKYHRELKYQNRVDYHLLDNIRAARDILKEKHKIEDYLANALIGKCIFVRYLIDRKVRIRVGGKLQEWENADFCELLGNKKRVIGFFKYLQDHFNGEAFLIDDSELDKVSQRAFDVLRRLLEGTEIKSGQRTLFDIYDFSIIPVEFISNVYEFFIGEENQAKKGAYYTPKFLVDYILTDTVENYFDENSGQYNCKVLDPACGSGIFLVEALRRIIEQYLSLNNEKISKEVLKILAEDNIFGIDEDINAINVAIFSIYLALLDYQEPKDIEDFTFPKLLQNGNFFKADFFDTNAGYNSRFSEIKFDFIIGNPPWKRGAFKAKKYIENRKQKEKEFNKASDSPEPTISNNEPAQVFLLRTSDFSNENTKCALIVTSKTLYNLNAKKFRCYFLHNYFVEKVFELAPVRREVFDKSNDKAIAPAAILFFRYAHGAQTDANILIHIALKPNRFFSLFKIFVLQRNDIKKVVQKRLKEYDYLWKVLVYGSYLDFNLIKRLKDNYKSFSEVIEEKDAIIGEGVQVGDTELYKVDSYLDKPFIDTRKDHIFPFFIHLDPNSKWKHKFVHRKRNKELFNPPALLTTRGIGNDFKANTAILYTEAIFTHAITSVKTSNKNLNILRTANGIMYSNLFSYYTLILASSTGIEREQLHDKEKFAFPFIDNPKISKTVKEIEKISNQLYKEKQQLLNPEVLRLEANKQALITQLDDEIFNSFDLDEQERTLVDYAVNVTIPLIMKHKGYEQKLFSSILFRDKLLEDYTNIFLSRFAASFREKHLKAEIWHTVNIVGIFFKVVPNNFPDQQTIEWQQKTNDMLLHKIVSLGIEKVTEELFIQKDIRGFEKKGFYIIKPNEKRLWHKAIGYLDVDEFMDAILKAGKEGYNG
jgi:16S rRNA G966 N2-methylase RsmD